MYPWYVLSTKGGKIGLLVIPKLTHQHPSADTCAIADAIRRMVVLSVMPLHEAYISSTLCLQTLIRTVLPPPAHGSNEERHSSTSLLYTYLFPSYELYEHGLDTQTL